MSIHRIKSIMSENEDSQYQDLTQDLSKCLEDLAKNQERKTKTKYGYKKSKLQFLYHEPQDEKYAIKEAISEVEDNDRHFREINEEVMLSSFLNIKSIIKRNHIETKNKFKELSSKIGVNLSFWLTVIGVIFTIFAGIISNLVMIEITSCILSLFFLIFIIQVILITKKQKKEFKDFLESANLDNIDINMLKPRDIKTFKSKEMYYINYKVCNKVWDIFEKCIQYMPSKAKISCLVLVESKGKVRDSIHDFRDNFYKQKEKFKEKGDRIIFNGDYLIPLEINEKFELIKSLQMDVKKLPMTYLGRGRDYIYEFNNNPSFYLSEEDYKNIINDIHIKECNSRGIDLKGTMLVVSYLASLKRFFTYVKSEIREPFQAKEVLEFFKKELVFVDENGKAKQIDDKDKETIISNVLREVYNKWGNDLLLIADREFSLMSDEHKSSEINLVQLDAYRISIGQFMYCLKNIGFRNKSYGIYSKAYFDVNVSIQKIVRWYNKKALTEFVKDMVNGWLEILKIVLAFNISCGYFIDNQDILKSINKLSDAIGEDKSLKDKFDSFYLSNEVKRSYMLNALVSPSVEINQDCLNESITNINREWHNKYMDKCVQLAGKELQIVPAPEFFELFGTQDDSDKYYSLILLNEEDDMLELYKNLYNLCVSVARENGRVTFKYFGRGKSSEIENKEFIKKNIINLMETIFDSRNCGELISDMLQGGLSSDEVLSCGLLDCDIFYLLHSIYQWLSSNSKSDENPYKIGKNIKSSSFRLIESLLYVELVKNKASASDVFDKIINTSNEYGPLSLFVKYYLCCINNIAYTELNILEMIKYINGAKLELSLFDDINLDFKDLNLLLSFCYNIKNCLEDEVYNRLSIFISKIKVKGDMKDAIDDFVKIVLDEEEVDISSEAQAEEIISRIKIYPADIFYLIFKKLLAKNNILYKFVPSILDKIIATDYNAQCWLINCLEFIPIENRNKIIMLICYRIEKRINICLDKNILYHYLQFFQYHSQEIDELKKNTLYSASMSAIINEKVSELEDAEKEACYSKLASNANFIMTYAKMTIDSIAKRLWATSQLSDGNTDIKFIIENVAELKIIIEKGGNYFYSKEYMQLITEIEREPNIILTYQIDNLKEKIVIDLMDILKKENIVYFKTEYKREKHINLLSQLITAGAR